MTPQLRELIVAAEGAGELDGDAVLRGRAEHPVCGDVLEVSLRVDDGVISDYAWRAQGCPATLGVAAAATVALRGCALADVASSLRERLASLGGLASHERHAERMMIEAIGSAR